MPSMQQVGRVWRSRSCSASALLSSTRVTAWCLKPRDMPRMSNSYADYAFSPTRWLPARTCSASPGSDQSLAGTPAFPVQDEDVVRVATVGDTVTIHFTCKDDQGQLLESSRDLAEPVSFEVGAGEIMGNKLFQGFDETIRGMATGQTAVITASGGDWKQELLFAVPRQHPEIQRMEGRYKSQGGLKPGLVVELSNNGMGVVVDMDDDVVKLDTNNMLAGKTLTFELEVICIDKAASEVRLPGPL